MGQTNLEKRRAELAAWQEQRAKLRDRLKELQAEQQAVKVDKPKDVDAAMMDLQRIHDEIISTTPVVVALDDKIAQAQAAIAEAEAEHRAAELAKAEPERDNALEAVQAAVLALSEAIDRLDRANSAVSRLGGERRQMRTYAALCQQVKRAQKTIEHDRRGWPPERPAEVVKRWTVGGYDINRPMYIKTTEVR